MSKPSKKALAYYFRNFFHILPFVIIPAAILGFASPAINSADTINSYLTGNVTQTNFVDSLFGGFSLLRYGNYWWITVIGILFAVLSISSLIYKINRHMQLGLNNNSHIVRNAIRGFLPTLLFVALLWFVSELLNFLVVGLMYFIVPNVYNTALVVVCMLLFLLADAFVAYLVSVFVCTLPAVHSERFSVNVAMSYSIRLMHQEWRSVVRIVATYVISRIMILTLCCVVTQWYWRWVICAVYYYMWLSFLPCFACRTYFRVNHDERCDLPQRSVY